MISMKAIVLIFMSLISGSVHAATQAMTALAAYEKIVTTLGISDDQYDIVLRGLSANLKPCFLTIKKYNDRIHVSVQDSEEKLTMPFIFGRFIFVRDSRPNQLVLSADFMDPERESDDFRYDLSVESLAVPTGIPSLRVSLEYFKNDLTLVSCTLRRLK